MFRRLILVLALAGPALAEQPTPDVGRMCGKEASYAVDQELKDLPFDIHKPESMKARHEALTRALNDTYLKTYERCMLENGFKFRADIHYCAANAYTPHEPNELMTGTSLLQHICYERIR
jgi:hypothetical protein